MILTTLNSDVPFIRDGKYIYPKLINRVIAKIRSNSASIESTGASLNEIIAELEGAVDFSVVMGRLNKYSLLDKF